MSIRHLLAATAHTSAQPAVDAYAMTAGRLGATAAGVLGLAGVVLGGLALARPHDTGVRRRAPLVALVVSLVGMALGGLVVATAEGGIGTGNGLGGGYVALVVGLIGAVLGGLAMTRSRRPA